MHRLKHGWTSRQRQVVNLSAAEPLIERNTRHFMCEYIIIMRGNSDRLICKIGIVRKPDRGSYPHLPNEIDMMRMICWKHMKTIHDEHEIRPQLSR
ncbi:hypothetical protein D3C84_1095310 [compost metagenome]